MTITPGHHRQVREAILSGPLLRTLLGLAIPTMGVMVAQMFIGIMETFYVGLLGRDALVGVALVFPVWMLMTMTSAGGIGGGVASAVSQALGGGRERDADALVAHALVMAVAFGALFTIALILLGPSLYRWLGGTAEPLRMALRYSNCVFLGAVPIWVVNLMSAALRGAGRVRVPAYVTIGGATLIIPLSPGLIFGVGPMPGLGIAGAGLALLTYYSLAAGVLLWVLSRGRSGISLRRMRLEARHFRSILTVGGVSALSTIQLNVTVLLITGIVGRFGSVALAGYGIATRLDYLLIPLLFGLGTATLTMIGTNLGARNYGRVRRICLVGTLAGVGLAEAIGLVVALFPQIWLQLFTSDPGVLEVGALYLRTVGPFYGALGTISMLSFVAQGGARPVWPLIGGSARLAVAVGLGWMAVTECSAGQPVLFAIIAAAASVAALTCVAAALSGALWPQAHADAALQRP